ncbi:MAG: transcription termination factor NusA [Candidatus Midichloria sp.]|nr:MAG: transcription termination factor NusA [Candidatus Midichloria sp.]
MAIAGFGGIEILQIVDAVSREKSIPKESVIRALEEALKIAARRKYGSEQQIRAEIDRKTGEIKLYKEVLVVANQEEVDTKYTEEKVQAIALEDAKLKDINVAVGDIICESLPAMDIGRIAAQSAKQVITLKVKEIEKDLQYEEFKDRIGEIINGVVEKVEYSNLIVKLGSAEALLRRDNLLRADHYRQGDRVRAYLVDIDRQARGPQVILSRIHEQFVAMLFAQEVPEIYENIIQIKAIARDPGSRTKIAVYSSDPAIDAVGSCVGIRGARVQAVISELKGEKIDIIQWTSDLGALIVNALAPASITKVLIDEEQHKIEVVVPEDQQSVAIGRQGQNVRLASKLIGWKLDVLTEEKEAKRRQDEFSAITQKFMEALDLEEILAQLLASEGYNSIQSISDANINELSSIQGLDVEIAQELINRARDYSESHADAEEIIAPSHLQDIANSPLPRIKMVTSELAERLHNNNINKIIDVADLSRDDFKDIIPDSGLDDEVIDVIIMDARKKSYFNKSNKIV